MTYVDYEDIPVLVRPGKDSTRPADDAVLGSTTSVAGLGAGSACDKILSEAYTVAEGSYLEITMNFPRVSSFTNKSSQQQKAIYTRIWNEIRGCCGVLPIESSAFVFEFCATGHVHLHGYIKYSKSFKHSPYGLVADYVKAYLKFLPKKHAKYNEHYMYRMFCRYRCPSIVVQWQDYDNETRFKTWLSYMNKHVILNKVE